MIQKHFTSRFLLHSEAYKGNGWIPGTLSRSFLSISSQHIYYSYIPSSPTGMCLNVVEDSIDLPGLFGCIWLFLNVLSIIGLIVIGNHKVQLGNKSCDKAHEDFSTEQWTSWRITLTTASPCFYLLHYKHGTCRTAVIEVLLL